MNNQFCIQEYVRMLGKKLVFEFNKAGMKFIVNEDQANTYHNYESVISVEEVKSVASMTEVKDAVKKI